MYNNKSYVIGIDHMAFNPAKKYKTHSYTVDYNDYYSDFEIHYLDPK